MPGGGAAICGGFGDRQLIRLVSSQGGSLSACSTDVVLALGGDASVEIVEVHWSGGRREQWVNLPGGGHFCLREGSGSEVRISSDD